MRRFIEGDNRQQITLLPESLDEYIEAENPVRIVDVFVDQLDLGGLGFSVEPAATGRPSYHPSTLLKLYVYGYLNHIQSSRRLEREAQRNIELMWLLGRLSPDFKTIADFRRDNGEGSRLIWRFSTVDRGALVHKYWSSDCPRCVMKEKCTPSPYRRVARGEYLCNHCKIMVPVSCRPRL